MATYMSISVFVLLVFYPYRCDATRKENTSLFREEVESLFNEFWEWRLINNPQLATKLGMSKYDDRLTEMSLSSYRRRGDQARVFLAKLRGFVERNMTNSTPDILLNINLLKDSLEQYLIGYRYMPYLFPINNMEGPHYDHIYLISLMIKTTEYDMRNILTRIRLFSQQIDEIITLLKEGIRLRLTMHRVSFEKLGSVYEKFASGPVNKNPLFSSFDEKPNGISNDIWENIVKEAEQTIKNYIQPSFRKLQRFLMEEYLPKSRPQIGVSSLHDGLKYYQECLKFHTTTNLSANEIHNIGLKEVHRINSRMDSIRKQVKYNGTVTQFRDYLRNDKKFGFLDELEMVEYYRDLEKKVRNILPNYIGKQTSIPLKIEPVPRHLAPSSPFAYYQEPSPDGDRPGIFKINTYEAEKKRKYVAVAVFLHEALPGHHTQIASKLQFDNSVSFRRYTGYDSYYYEVPASFSSNNAFTEGWALYAEYLGEEMGLYKNPYDLFGRLSLEMLRAARLVVDTGMHVMGWSRSKAINFMKTYTAEDVHTITAEVDRYISWPGQACSYKIGEIKIRELRRLAANRLERKFVVRDFHDFLISVGNIPLTILEEQVQVYIQKKLKED